jgi:hypothetical protein
MKTANMSFTALFSLCMTLSFGAINSNINGKILASFHKEFAKAEDESWKTLNGYEVVTFKMENRYLTAYYQESGELKAVTRNICTDQLPLYLQNSLKSNYKGFWITDLFEIASNSETHYFISVENPDEKLVLSSVESVDWSIVEKSIKN